MVTDKTNTSKSSESTSTSSDDKISRGVESKSDNDQMVAGHRSSIKEKFLVDMPQDFYDFWEFCKDFNPITPGGILLPYK